MLYTLYSSLWCKTDNPLRTLYYHRMCVNPDTFIITRRGLDFGRPSAPGIKFL